jgi:hypothetical protein
MVYNLICVFKIILIYKCFVSPSPQRVKTKWEGANVFYGNEAKDMGMQETQSLCDSDVTICHRKVA